MANETFRPGDIVQLKSGSPAFTVQASGPDTTRVYWYVTERQQVEMKDIPTATLKLHEAVISVA